MSLVLVALAAAQIGAAQPAVQPVALECRREGSSNGARVGRKICRTSAEWAAIDGWRYPAWGRPNLSAHAVGDADNRTMSRPLQLR